MNTIQKIKIREGFGWKLYEINSIKIWFSGYLTNGKNIEGVLLDIASFPSMDFLNIEYLSKWLLSFSGNFAFVIKFSDDSCFLAVDKICSIPIFDVTKGNRYAVSNYAPYLKEMFDMDNSNVSLQSLLEISMSGFCIGNKSIYRDINRLMAGECIFWNHGKKYKNYYSKNYCDLFFYCNIYTYGKTNFQPLVVIFGQRKKGFSQFSCSSGFMGENF